VPVITQQLFKDRHLTLDHFEGHIWTETIWFSVTIPAGTTINSVMCRLRTSKFWGTTIFGIVIEGIPCIETGYANVFELNGYSVWDKPVHINKVVEGDGKIYLISGDNSVRICLRKPAPLDSTKLDQIFDAWIDIDYTGEEPTTKITTVTKKEEATPAPEFEWTKYLPLILVGVVVFVVIILFTRR